MPANKNMFMQPKKIIPLELLPGYGLTKPHYCGDSSIIYTESPESGYSAPVYSSTTLFTPELRHACALINPSMRKHSTGFESRRDISCGLVPSDAIATFLKYASAKKAKESAMASQGTKRWVDDDDEEHDANRMRIGQGKQTTHVPYQPAKPIDENDMDLDIEDPMDMGTVASRDREE